MGEDSMPKAPPMAPLPLPPLACAHQHTQKRKFERSRTQQGQERSKVSAQEVKNPCGIGLMGVCVLARVHSYIFSYELSFLRDQTSTQNHTDGRLSQEWPCAASVVLGRPATTLKNWHAA